MRIGIHLKDRQNWKTSDSVQSGLAMSSRRRRTAFTPTQKQELEAAYKGGLNSVAAENGTAIGDLARSLDLEVDVVKVLIIISF